MNKRTIWTGLIIKLLMINGLLINPISSFANVQDDAAFTCSSAVNVMDCIKQTNTGTMAPRSAAVTDIPLNSGILGFTGPLSAGLRYDNYLAWILDIGYAQSFKNAAAAFKLSAGLNEMRANVSLGYAISPKQQIKLTYEYLSQNLPYDFASGKVNQWVNQNALGAAYRYIIDHDILRSVEVYGTYTKAGSKELSEVEMYTDNLLTQINYRRIAGGTEITGGGAATITPFKGTLLKLGAGYSNLTFDTKWEKDQPTAALLYNAELSQILTPKMMVSAGIGSTASGQNYTAKVSHILPWSLEASLLGQYTATTNDIPSSTSVTASLSYPAPKTYENVFAAGLGALKDWVEKPLVYHSRVLAKAEERLVQVQITTKPIPDKIIPVGFSLDPQISTKDYFLFNPGIYNKIDYNIISVVTKADQNPVDTRLNLQVIPTDSFNAVISSLTPTTQEMMPSGQAVTYIVTVQSQGYRNGQVVSKITNPVNINITPNQKLGQANWMSNPTLPTGNPNGAYNSGQAVPLNNPNYITPTIPGETFTFNIVDNTQAPWISLTPDHKSLIATPGMNIPADLIDKQVSIKLSATSQASELNARPAEQMATIPVNSSVILPAWQKGLPDATEGVTYSLGTISGSPYVLDPYSALTGGFLSKTKVNNGDLPNDQITFQISPDAASRPTPCTWLEVTPDGKSITSKPYAVTLGACFAYLDVISAKGNNGQPSPLAPQKINVNTATYELPNWINADVSFPMVLKGANFPETTLNPYKNTTNPLLTKTLKNGQPYDDNTLTFSMDKSKGGSTQASCQWLNFKNNDDSQGTLIGTADKTCTVYLSVSSADANNTRILKEKPITVINLPDKWLKNPSWVSNIEATTSTINPYYAGNGGFLSKTSDGLGSDLPDNLVNYSIVGNQCGDWLKILDDVNGTLTGKPPVSAETTKCVITLKADSNYQKDYELPPLEITVASNGSPQWKPLPYAIILNYPNDSNYSKDANNNYKILPSDALLDTSGISFSNLTINPNLPSNGINQSLQVAGTTAYVAIKPTVADIDNSKTSANYSVMASKSGGTDSVGNFTVQVKADLINPQPLPGIKLPPAQVDADYAPVNLDPYQSAPTKYLYRTRVQNINEELPIDTVHFRNYSGSDNLNNPCTWANISDSGLLTAIDNRVDTSSVNDCFLYYDVQSSKNNNVWFNKLSISIPSSLIVPAWDRTSNNIKFDANSFNEGIDLTAMLNPYSMTNALTFYFAPNVNQDNWFLQKNTSGNNHIYLMRRPNSNLYAGTWDSSKVGSTETIDIIATNEKGTAPAQTLTITINPDDKVKLQFNYKDQLLSTSIGQAAAIDLLANNDPRSNFLQAVAPDNNLITNDSITLDSVVAKSNNTNNVVASYNPQIFKIEVPATLTQADFGTYTPKLTNVVSRARGSQKSTLDMQGYLTIDILPTQWKTTDASIKFDALTKNGAISLNNMVYNPDSIDQLTFKFTDNAPGNMTFGNFQIIQEGYQWYLTRITQTQNEATVVDARDVSSIPQPIRVSECLNPDTCIEATLNITVLPDNNVSINIRKPEQSVLTVFANEGKSFPVFTNNVNTDFVYTLTPDHLPVLDIFTINSGLTAGAIVTNPTNSGSTIAYYDAQGRNIVIPNNLANDKDPKLYNNNLSFKNLQSRARGSTIDTTFSLDGFISILVQAYPQWLNNNPMNIKYSQVSLDSGGSNNLNNRVANATSVPNLRFEFAAPDNTNDPFTKGKYKILSTANNPKIWYIARYKIHDGASGVDYLDAQDVGTTLDNVNVIACTSTTSCNVANDPNGRPTTTGFNITLAADSSTRVYWEGPSVLAIKYDSSQTILAYIWEKGDLYTTKLNTYVNANGVETRVMDILGMDCSNETTRPGYFAYVIGKLDNLQDLGYTSCYFNQSDNRRYLVNLSITKKTTYTDGIRLYNFNSRAKGVDITDGDCKGANDQTTNKKCWFLKDKNNAKTVIDFN